MLNIFMGTSSLDIELNITSITSRISVQIKEDCHILLE